LENLLAVFDDQIGVSSQKFIHESDFFSVIFDHISVLNDVTSITKGYFGVVANIYDRSFEIYERAWKFLL